MAVGELLLGANIQGLFHFNGNSSDASDNANTGSDTNITYPVAKFGQGALFNGTSSFISIADKPGLRFTTAFTMMGWVNLTNNGKLQPIYSKNNPDTNPGGLIWAINSSNKQRITIRGVADIDDTGPVAFSTAKFYHVAVIHSGPSYDFYVNAVLNSSITDASTPSTGTLAADFGRARFASDIWLDGVLDECGLYNAAITPQTLKNYYAWATGKRTSVA